MLTSVTLHSNNARLLRHAVRYLGVDPTAALSIPRLFGYKVASSLGNHVSEDAARDYRFHTNVPLPSGWWKRFRTDKED